MKKEVIIQVKKNNSKIVNYDDLKKNDSKLENYFEEIIKEILEIDTEFELYQIDNKNYILLNKDKELISELNVSSTNLKHYVVNMNKDNKLYEYRIDIFRDIIKTKIKSCKFIKNNVNYIINVYNQYRLINICDKDNGITIEVKNEDNDEEKIIESVININIEDGIKEIYEKINKKISFADIKIKKSKLINSRFMQELITDIIIINNNRLEDFLITITKKDKTYKIKKENNNYSLSVINSSIEALTSAYFEINEQVQFVKKLEKKK